MKIYFTASIAAKDRYLKNYEAIVTYLKKKEHTVIADHIIVANQHKIDNETREQSISFHNKLIKWIRSADCLVAETSFPSISVGYEISLALQFMKPVLLLYSTAHPPSLLVGMNNEKLVSEQYTQDTLSTILDDFITFVSGTNDLRFTFFINSEMNNFLTKISRQNKVPKSVYLRYLIQTQMNK